MRERNLISKSIFDGNVFNDNPVIHPIHMRRSCHRKIQHQASGRIDYHHSKSNIPSILQLDPQWCENCNIRSYVAPRHSTTTLYTRRFPCKKDDREITNAPGWTSYFISSILFMGLARGSIQATKQHRQFKYCQWRKMHRT